MAAISCSKGDASVRLRMYRPCCVTVDGSVAFRMLRRGSGNLPNTLIAFCRKLEVINNTVTSLYNKCIYSQENYSYIESSLHRSAIAITVL